MPSLRIGRLYTSSDGGSSWTERRPDGVNIDREWKTVACDSDGSVLIVASCGYSGKGRLYISTDYGVTWTEKKPDGDGEKQWNAVGCDSDGSVIIVLANGSKGYISTDSGLNWTEINPDGIPSDPSDFWCNKLAISSDGSLILVSKNLKAYKSTNYGSSWTEIGSAYGSVNTIKELYLNDAGKILGLFPDNRIVWYKASKDYWVYSIQLASWVVGAKSNDFAIMGRSSSPYQIKSCNDYGQTPAWSDVSYQPTSGLTRAACDSDGSNVFICGEGVGVYLSTNSGVDWTEIFPEPGKYPSFTDIAVDSDGSFIIICANHYEVIKKKLYVMGFF